MLGKGAKGFDMIAEEFVVRVAGHFKGHQEAEIHVGASDNPFRILHSNHKDALKRGHWLCRRAPSREIAEAVVERLGGLGMNVVNPPDGWSYVYAFRKELEADRAS